MAHSSKWLTEITRVLNAHGAEIYTIQALPDHKVVYWSTTADPMRVAGTFGGRTWQQAYNWLTDHLNRWNEIPRY